jgi:hypothetical protein
MLAWTTPMRGLPVVGGKGEVQRQGSLKVEI